MAIEGLEVQRRDDGENGVVSLSAHNAALAITGMPPVGPDEWFGVILADHGLVGTFCTKNAADAFLSVALA